MCNIARNLVCKTVCTLVCNLVCLGTDTQLDYVMDSDVSQAYSNDQLVSEVLCRGTAEAEPPLLEMRSLFWGRGIQPHSNERFLFR